MQTNALKLAEQTAKNGQAERLSWGALELQVTDLSRAVGFWTAALGLYVLDQDDKKAVLGTQTKTFFVLHAGAKTPVSAPYTGMYHVAVGVPNQNEFSRMMARLHSLGIPQSPTDHLMAKSTYIKDPDGLEIEITLETPERFGRFGDASRGIQMFDTNGNTHSGREALDVRAELAIAEGADLEAALSNDAFMAHLHFKVGHLDTAATWFEQLGFARNLFLPNFGFADLGAGAAHTHRLAMNTWAGTNLDPTPNDMAKLLRYELLVHDESVFTSAKDVLQTSNNNLSGVDPTGTEITVMPQY